ncbi:transposase [Paraburkholderia sp.]|uniref:transposase n=1 Tax=Paraburkholderia sp. TaxID=1926495 RepID=UPI00261ECF35|nr:transposase [Paraburkholderia sp.]
MSSADTLPDDIEALKALLRERDARIERMQNQLVSRDAVIATGKAEIEHLKLLIAKLRRMQFGRKSEKLDWEIEQLELRLEDLEADEDAAPITSAVASLEFVASTAAMVSRRPATGAVIRAPKPKGARDAMLAISCT